MDDRKIQAFKNCILIFVVI